MAITLAESGLSSDDYAYLQTQQTGPAYKLEAHKWSLDWGDSAFYTSGNVSANEGNDFDAVGVNGHLVRATADTDGPWILTYNGSAWNETQLGGPEGGSLPSVSMTYEAIDGGYRIYLYVTSTLGIYVNTSDDYGVTWLESWVQAISYAVPDTDASRRSFLVSAARPGYVFWTTFQEADKTVLIRASEPFSGLALTAGSTDLYLASEVRSISAIATPSTDDSKKAVLFASMDVPGRTSAQYVNQQVVKYIYRAGGIVSFPWEHGTFGDHTEIDMFDNLTNFAFRENVKASKFGETFFLTHSAGDGTINHPFVRYRYHTSKDGKWWSDGFIMHGIPGIGHAGLKIVQAGDYTFAFTRRITYRSPSTLLVENSTIRFDLTDDVLEYSFGQSDMAQAQVMFSDQDGVFSDPSYTNPANTWALIHSFGYDSPTGPITQQVSIHQVDQWVAGEQIDENGNYQKVVQVSSRDRESWMTDLVHSEQAHYWQAQLASADSYRDDTETAYGGLTHTATETGSWKTEHDALLLCNNNQEAIAFSTFSTDLWNGAQEIGFRLSKDNNGEYGGVVFRAVDQDNLWILMYTQSDDKVYLMERRGGVTSIVAGSSTMSWVTHIIHEYRFLKVIFRYATIYAYASDDGKTWTALFSYIITGARRINREYEVVTARPLERGYVGVIGKGFSTIEGWEPDVPIDIGALLDDNGDPGADTNPLVADSFVPNKLYYLQLDGTVTLNYHDSGLGSDVAVDISPSGTLMSHIGDNTAVQLVVDPSTAFRRFLILGAHGILACDDVKADAPVWYTAYHSVIENDGYFAAVVANGRGTQAGSLAAARKKKGTFAWLGFVPISDGTRVDLYVYVTKDNFKTVNRTLVFEDVVPGGQNISIGPYPTGTMYISSGLNVDPLSNGVWKSPDWGSSWTHQFDEPAGDIGIPLSWSSGAVPYLLSDGSPNLNNNDFLTTYNHDAGVHYGTVIGFGADSITLDNSNGTFPHETDGWDVTPQGVIPTVLTGEYFYTLLQGSAQEGSDPATWSSSVIEQHVTRGTPLVAVSTRTFDSGSGTQPVYWGINGWPTNRHWFVAFGERVTVGNNTSYGAGFDFDFDAHGPVTTALPDYGQLPDDNPDGFNYDDYPPFDDLADDGWGDDTMPPEQCVTFVRNYVNDNNPPQVVEDAFKAYANFGGVHNFKFLTVFDWSKSVVDDWVSQTGVTFEQIDDTLTIVTASGADATHPKGSINTAYEVPHNFLLSAYMTATAKNGFFVNGRHPDSTAFTKCHYYVGFDSSRYPHILKYDEGSNNYILQYKLPIAVPTQGVVQIAVREMTFTADKNDFWLVFSIWVNHRLYFTWSEWIKEVPDFAYYIGLASTDNATYSTSGATIPQLTDFVEWNSLDPSESPMDGLNRSIDGRYLRFHVRWDGSLYAWRPVAVASSQTFSNDDIEDLQRITDLRQVITHVRMLGAYQQAEAVVDDLGIHRYQEANNPYLMSERECYSEAVLYLKRQREQSDQVTFTIPYRPLLECGDRITLEIGDYIIDQIDQNLEMVEGTASINARKYVYGA